MKLFFEVLVFVELLEKSMCVRPCLHPSVPAAPKRYRVRDKKSSFRNGSGQRNASNFSDKKLGFAMVTPSSVTKLGVVCVYLVFLKCFKTIIHSFCQYKSAAGAKNTEF